MMARLIFCLRPIMAVLERNLPERGLIMDLGCGYGIVSNLVSIGHPGRTIIGVDMSSRRIEIAKRSAVNKKNLEFHLADIREFQIPHCSAIMIIDVLSMFPYKDQEQVLVQCYEKLNAGGIMIIKDNSKSPYWKHIYMRVEEAIKVKLRVYGSEVKKNSLCVWSDKEFLMLLERIGFNAKAIPLNSRLPYPGVFYVCRK